MNTKTMLQLVCAVIAMTRLWIPAECGAQQFMDRFDRLQLTDTYYSEGVGAGDINGDQQTDIVYGPYWFAGPDFKQKHEIYPAKPQPTERYADHFFAWVQDLNGDGANDVFVVGFPGTPAYVYENPKSEGLARHWPKHRVFDSVANESPHFTNLVGDAFPELVCTRDGFFGFATIERDKPFSAWTFHAISDKIAPGQFGHGLGVGDVNGDGKLDVLMKDGWFEQPQSSPESGRWELHPAAFASPGGAEMYAYDVDGDGDNDVITSLAAHEFGLAWHEQIRKDDKVEFKRHLIVGAKPEQNRYGVVFSELHSVNLADIDGDGLKDIVTGKTYWSHHRQSPMWDAGAVVYWFRLVRTPQGVDWVPYLADGEAGIGRQLLVHDVNRDGQPDLLSGGMKGAHLLTHHREPVSAARYQELQPKPYVAPEKQTVIGPPSVLDAQTGRVADSLEGESLKVLGVTGGKTVLQIMAGFKAARWSNDKQLFWSGAKIGDKMELELNVPQAGKYAIHAALTMARDYATIKILLDDQPLAGPLDLFNYPDVINTGMLTLGEQQLAAGNHRLVIEIAGANPSAAKSYLVGLDYVKLIPR